MNQRMYINYLSTIYYLTSIYNENMDFDLKISIKNIIKLLQSEVSKYYIPPQDNKLKNFKVEDLSILELITKSKQTMAIVGELSNNIEIKKESQITLEYLKMIYKKEKMEEGMRNDKY